MSMSSYRRTAFHHANSSFTPVNVIVPSRRLGCSSAPVLRSSYAWGISDTYLIIRTHNGPEKGRQVGGFMSSQLGYCTRLPFDVQWVSLHDATHIHMTGSER